MRLPPLPPLLCLLPLLASAPARAQPQAPDKISEDDRVLIDDESEKLAAAAAAKRRAEAKRRAQLEAAWDPTRCIKALPLVPKKASITMDQVRQYIVPVVDSFMRRSERAGAWTVRDETGRTRRLKFARVYEDSVSEEPRHPGFFGTAALLRDLTSRQDALAVFTVDFRGRSWCVSETRVDKLRVETVPDDPAPAPAAAKR